MSDPQQLNSYAYTRNNPLNLVDPDGKQAVMPNIQSMWLGAFRGDRFTASAMERVYNGIESVVNAGKSAVSFAGDWTIAGDTKVLLTGENFSGGSDSRLLAAFGLLTGGKGDDAIKALRRPYIRKWVREAVEKVTKRTPDGRPIDPNLGTPIDGKPDLGHKTGEEFRTHKQQAENAGLTQPEFNNKMNNPDIYQLEDPASNRSHMFEE